jgi:hypothetical protein
MPKIHFIGRVLPIQYAISVVSPEVHWKASDGEAWSGKFKVIVANSIINVEVETDKYTPELASEIFKHAYDLSRTSVNMVAFAMGLGPQVILETLINPEGIPTVLLPQHSPLSEVVSVLKVPCPTNTDFLAVFNI